MTNNKIKYSKYVLIYFFSFCFPLLLISLKLFLDFEDLPPLLPIEPPLDGLYNFSLDQSEGLNDLFHDFV